PTSITQGGSVNLAAVASSPENRPLTYIWTASAGTISGSGSSVILNTGNAAAGSITIICKVSDDQGRSASATTTLTVTAATSAPPNIQCSANPAVVTQGATSTLTAVASSPEGRPLTYTWSATSGAITGTGTTATLNTTGAPTGSITVTCSVADNQGLTASATTQVVVNAAASGIQPAQCIPATITQPAPIVSTPVSISLPAATTINVMLDGATGNGATNDSPALQSIVSTNPNATIYFPAGQYVLDNPSLNQPGLLFSGFHGTAIMASGARFLCDTATTSAGQCIYVLNSSNATFDNFRVGYLDEQNLPLSRNNATNNAILVENSTTVAFNNTTVEASTGSGIWVTGSTNISFLSGTSVSNTAADGLHFENVGNAVVDGYTAHNTGDDALSATNISATNPNCGLNATNIQIFDSASRGIAVAGACGSAFSNFYIENTANSGLGIGQDATINSLVPANSTFSNGTVVNAGHYPSSISSSKDCIDVSLSTSTKVSNVECSNPMIDGLFVFDGADQVTVSGVTVDAAANVGFQAVDSTNVSLSNTVNRNSVNAGYALQQMQGGSITGAATCSSGEYGFYHSAATTLTETNLMSYDAAENDSNHRVWWAENSSQQISVNGISVLDDQTHTAPDVVGGATDPAGSITVNGITQDLLGTTLSLLLP
ncbi:MAG TPA: glycosyl hydrolase family 28-related protein, partial [Acidobacteriaceae bacterium]|nr:glycosyl hydrolase family 28-related protein [Acidobacteriaceae bacterium]